MLPIQLVEVVLVVAVVEVGGGEVQEEHEDAEMQGFL